MFFDDLFEVCRIFQFWGHEFLTFSALTVLRAYVFYVQVCVASVGDIDGTFPQVPAVTISCLPDVLVDESAV